MDRRLYLVTRNGGLIIDASDGQHEVTPLLDELSLECIAVSDRAPDYAFVGTFASGLYRTTDGGNHFERVGAEQIGPDSVTSVAIDPFDHKRIWAGTEPSELYRSDDGGDTWQLIQQLGALPTAEEWSFPPRPDTHHVRWIEPDPTKEGTIYVGIEAGALLRTTDGGEQWDIRPNGSRRDNHTLATHADAPGRVYSAAGDGYAESSDYGQSWEHPTAGLEHSYVWGLAVDPGDSHTCLVSAAHSAAAAHRRGGAYLYRKHQAHDSWHQLTDIAVPTGNGARRAVLASGFEPGELYAATVETVSRTVDGGDTWSNLAIDWPSHLATALPTGLALTK